MRISIPVLLSLIALTNVLSGESFLESNFINELRVNLDRIDRSYIERNPSGLSYTQFLDRLVELDEKGVSSSTVVLLNLNHAPTISKYVQLIEESDHSDRMLNLTLSRSRSVGLAFALFEVFDKKPLKFYPHPNPEISMDQGVSGAAIQIVTKILARTLLVSPDMREWADQLDTYAPVKLEITKHKLQAWRKFNETAISEQRFEDLVPYRTP